METWKCDNCHTTYFVHPEDTEFRPREEGAMVLCEECWQELIHDLRN